MAGLSIAANAVQAQPVELRDIQAALDEMGYDPGPVDGVWGKRTEAALNAFQIKNGFQPSREVCEEQLVLLGLIAPPKPPVDPNAPEWQRQGAESEEQYYEVFPYRRPPHPIEGDLDAVMGFYGQALTDHILLHFSQRVGIELLSTEGYPINITFGPTDPDGLLSSVRIDDKAYHAREVVVEADDLTGQPTFAIGLELFTVPGALLPAPDDLCEGMGTGLIAAPVSHFCLTGGAIVFGGYLEVPGNWVICTEGGITVTNANQDQSFIAGTRCAVNGTQVVFADGGWREQPG